MSNMLKAFVKKEMENQIKKRYPNVQYPAGMYAKIVRISEDNSYTLQILNKSMTTDSNFPEIPHVKSSIDFTVGEIAVVLLLYGGSYIHIIGRYES